MVSPRKPTEVDAPTMMLWLSDNRGVYIPRDFATSFKDRAKNVKGVSDADWAILEAGPEHEEYWDAWSSVLDNATVTDDHGREYTLHQDGDLWLVPLEWVWDEDTGKFHAPREEG